MRIFLMIIIFLSFISTDGYGWRAYTRYRLGAEANAIGGAYVGDASTEIAMNYNPAGLVQLEKTFSMNYEVSTSMVILDIFAWDIEFNLDYFPFFSFYYGFEKWKIGTSLSTLFDAFADTDLHIRSWKFTVAYPINDALSVGLGIGPIFATENTARGYSWNFNTGILWKIRDKAQVGLSFHSPFTIDWKWPIAGATVIETYPWIVELGMTYAAGETFLLFGSLEYMGIDDITYYLEGVNASPNFKSNIFSRLHPHVGVRFLENITGAHISLGFMMDSSYYDEGGLNQYQLTAGIRAYGKNTIFNASWIDSLIFTLINPYNTHEEKVNVSFSFKFQ